ncbi:hypothetical protein [Polyangium spumosum]|uniref:Uncharacterized protein n=1 Tax=Polyangium spumosum TaxID=889282 RepID=A0A6N7Q280_9BACT|nr:hypothetical protein [Polyangium spumosum]MRG98139.1 hypothetical protein [Polyangium spumosum]
MSSPEGQALVERWIQDFDVYRARIEQVDRDVSLDLLARLARVGVAPAILRSDIDARRARGWTMAEIGPVLDALAMATHRATTSPEAREHAALARAMFDAMAEGEPRPLVALAALVSPP